MKKLIYSITPEELLNCDYIEENSVNAADEDEVFSVQLYKYFNDKKRQGLYAKRQNGWEKYGYAKSLENAVKKLNRDIDTYSRHYKDIPFVSKFYLVYSDDLKSHSYKAPVRKSCKKFVNVEAMF